MEFINFFDEKYSIIIKQKIVTVLRLISSYGQGFLNQSQIFRGWGDGSKVWITFFVKQKAGS